MLLLQARGTTVNRCLDTSGQALSLADLHISTLIQRKTGLPIRIIARLYNPWKFFVVSVQRSAVAEPEEHLEEFSRSESELFSSRKTLACSKMKKFHKSDYAGLDA
ncbi:hypothetical protein [Rhizobium tropici]|uniref:Uncharacterized protein n=1 Tax=Rhizobium tropici TaxID=398 RepID=A0A329YL48_RHITR|nr:hypothetical protein [Rhizobium tropici]RAX43254.1 hypothetical protein DQ393_02265 [Rhizobium tropici]